MVKKISNAMWLVLSVFLVFALTSCDDFYSTSWGKARDYDASKIKLTENNLQRWKENAVGNPALAEALVKKIISVLDSKSGAEKAVFQQAGIELAIEQAGIGTKIIEVAGSALSNIDSEDGLKDLLNKVQTGLGDVGPAAGNIATIVGKSKGIEEKSYSAGDIPEFDSSDVYAATASPSDVGMAVMVLALSIIPNDKIASGEITVGGLEGFEFAGNLVKVTRSPPTQKEIALAAYLNLIVQDETERFDDNQITSGIKDAFLSNS
jgi:hypothetical protein